MDADLDTLVTALYVEIDELIGPRHGRGRRPLLSDAELVCLAVMQVLLRFPSERHWLRYARKHLGGRPGMMFPYLPDQDGYNKRMRKAGPLLARVMRHLATRSPSWWDQLRLIDSTPVPGAASRERVKRSDLAGEGAGDAGYGYCASHSRYFWGYRLYLVTTAEGMPVIWGLAHPKLGEREVMTALLEADHHLVRDGQVILADKGLRRRRVRTGHRPARRPPGAPGPPRRTGPPWPPRPRPPMDRSDLRHPQRPTRPGVPRRANPRRGLRTRRPTPARPDHRDLAQLDHQRPGQAIPDRLRPLTVQRINHLGRVS